MPYIKKYISVLFIFILLVSLCGCGEKTDPEAELKSVTYVDSMDTFMTLTAYGSNRTAGLKAAEAEILRLNDLFSIGVESSEVSIANREGRASLSPETVTVIEKALSVNDMTGGCFDISVTPLMELWGFTTGVHKIPADDEISAVLSLTGSEKIEFDAEHALIVLKDGARIDLGGIAKGYTSQRVMDVFKENGVKSAIVSLGGNVQCLGLKPDGSKWRVAIREPWGFESSYVAVLDIENKAVITSGGYERYFEDEATGKIYCHILDPKTGSPVITDLESVSIVSEDGTLADGLSTALYIMGLEKACDFWRANSDKFDIVLIDSDGNIYASSGIYDDITTDKNLIRID